jgi:hypothetical protein
MADMSHGLFQKPVQVHATEQRLRIRWDDLGRPTEPCTREYNGELIDVRQRDIAAAQGNPNAVFIATRFRPWTGREYYRLGSVQIAEKAPAPPKVEDSPNAEPRHLLIKWSDLGCPSKPGTFGYRGLIVDVQEKNIVAAGGDSDAVFKATHIRPHTGRSYYILGKVQADA